MSKGDHSRNWAYKIPPTEFVKRHEAIDWSESQVHGEQSVRVCLECKVPKPSGRHCDSCGRDTDSERIYVGADPGDENDHGLTLHPDLPPGLDPENVPV